MLATRSFPFEINLADLGIYVTGTCDHLRGSIDCIDLDGGPRLEFSRIGYAGDELKTSPKAVIANAIHNAIVADYWHELQSIPDDRAATRADRLRAEAI